MSMSDYLEDKILTHIAGKGEYTPPTTMKVALCTSAPSDSGIAGEVSESSYERQEVTFAASSGGVMSNEGDVVFPIAEEAWGTITHIAILDESENLLFHSALTREQVVNIDNQLIFKTGKIKVQLD